MDRVICRVRVKVRVLNRFRFRVIFRVMAKVRIGLLTGLIIQLELDKITLAQGNGRGRVKVRFILGWIEGICWLRLDYFSSGLGKVLY